MTDSDEVKLLPCVTHAFLQFADGSKLSVEFGGSRSLDEALSTLRMASTSDPRPPVVTDEVVERVARAIALECDLDPDVFIGMHGRRQWEKQFHAQARAAIASMPAVVSGGQSTGDHALPPSGLSQSSLSQAKPAAAIARRKL